MAETEFSDNELRKILSSLKTIVMVGVSLSEIRPSYFVAKYFSLRGITVIPVNPAYTNETLWGQKVYSNIEEIPKSFEIDMVNIFRRSEEAPAVVSDAVRYLFGQGLKLVWLQVGVISKEATIIAQNAGLPIVMNKCPKIEHQRLFGDLRKAGFNTGIISSKLPSL